MNCSTQIRLFEGDCADVMAREIPDKSVDVVVTSPPYNIGAAYGQHQDQMESEVYIRWARSWAAQVFRVLKDDGSFFLNIGSPSRNPLLAAQVLLTISPDYFLLQNNFCWVKSIAVPDGKGGERTVGHYKPKNSRRFVNDCHESVFHLTKFGNVTIDRLSAGTTYSDKSNLDRWEAAGGRDLRCRGNTWFIPYKTIQSKATRPHPASFPVALAERCIRLHGDPAECAEPLTVLDPFVGIGSAGLAAQVCGVQEFIGIDIDSEYLAVAHDLLVPKPKGHE